MIPIKIQCGCGQRYAFDAEPVNGRLATSVACPACGADGTAAANAIIAQSMPAKPAMAVAEPAVAIAAPVAATPSKAPLRISISRPAEAPAAAVEETTAVAEAPARPAARRLLPGQLARPQAEQEARAKISWGDAPEDVVKFLMLHAFTYQEASEVVDEMFRERAKTIRANGIKKIFFGIGLMCVPVVTLVVFLMIGIMFLKLLAVAIMIGLYGAYCVLKGIFMVLAPKSEPGDVAEQ